MVVTNDYYFAFNKCAYGYVSISIYTCSDTCNYLWASRKKFGVNGWF